MKTIELNGVSYNVCAPRKVAPDKYTCDAFKRTTGRVIKNHEKLNTLGRMYFQGGGEVSK